MVFLILSPTPKMHFHIFSTFETCSDITTSQECSLTLQAKIKFFPPGKNSQNFSLLLLSSPFAMGPFGNFIKRGNLFPHALNLDWPSDLHWPKQVAGGTVCQL